MEYEVIKNITDEQLAKIKKERNQSFSREKVCIVRVNGIEIGFAVTIFICGRLTIEYYLFAEYQHKGYGSQFVSIITDWISSENPSYDTVYLLIYRKNIPSMKVALKSGYIMNCEDWDFKDMIHDEMPEHYVYSKPNSYYKNNHYKLEKVPKYKGGIYEKESQNI